MTAPHVSRYATRVIDGLWQWFDLLADEEAQLRAIALFVGLVGAEGMDRDQLLALIAREVRFCRRCGCTDALGCAEGCSWVDVDLCSACEERVPLEACICGAHFDCPDGWHYGDALPCSCTPDCVVEHPCKVCHHPGGCDRPVVVVRPGEAWCREHRPEAAAGGGA